MELKYMNDKRGRVTTILLIVPYGIEIPAAHS